MAGTTNDNPCYGCTERYGGCHAECPKGLAWSKKDKARRAEIRAARQKDVQATSAIIELKESIKTKRK